MIRFSRCAGGPVTWIGWTFGAGSGSCASAAPAHKPSAAAAVISAFSILLINFPSVSKPLLLATLAARSEVRKAVGLAFRPSGSGL